MTVHFNRFVLSGVLLILLLAGCASKPTDRGQQYKDGRIHQASSLVNQPNAIGTPVNASDFINQLQLLQDASQRLYRCHQGTFSAIERWLAAGGDTRQLRNYSLNSWQMEGADHYGNVQFTGYYTPVIQARYVRQGEFRYPIYRMPPKKRRGKLPRRAEIYKGALSPRYVIGWSHSLIDNFLMEVQGSGYVDFGDGRPLTFFGYGGKNGWPYHSIGKELIDRGEVTPEQMSMQAIRSWAGTHSGAQVRGLLETNDSFVFFKPEPFTQVRGASAVPLVAKASVASDKSLIPPGTVLLAEVPQLNKTGKFDGKYQLRLMVALDVGGAIKGQHLDIYQGAGQQAAHLAGFYNHYGRVWILKSAPGTGVFTGKS